jgi:hypothetical protein
MRLVRFVTNDSPSKPGVMIDDAVVALSDLLPDAPIDMISVIGVSCDRSFCLMHHEDQSRWRMRNLER